MLADLGIDDVALVAIAKGPDRDAGRERFFLPDGRTINFEPSDPVLYFLQRLRDEAHRFAIGSHRGKRSKAIGQSILDEIPGIGARRKRALLHHFGSARAVARAGLADLAAVEGISGASPKKFMIISTATAKLRRAPERIGHRLSHSNATLLSLPNVLTLSRIVMIPLLVAAFFLPRPVGNWTALAIFAVASITDFFDGYVARRRAQFSDFGRFLDPIADKLLVAAALLMLAAFDRLPGLAILPAVVILCARSWSRACANFWPAPDRRAGQPPRQVEDHGPDGGARLPHRRRRRAGRGAGPDHRRGRRCGSPRSSRSSPAMTI